MYNSSSGDVFCEVMVDHKKGMAEYLKTALAIVAGILLTFALMIFMPALFILVIAIWGLVMFFIRLQRTEYEYIFTSGSLDIDKISGAFRRKRKMTVSMEQMELVAPEDSHELDKYEHGNYKVYDYSANDTAMKNYVIVGNIGNEQQVKLIFTPDENMVERMYHYSPRKVRLSD
ncbi:MAG: FUSC family protein [Clostridiales bacterium]|nr:FUSC family protein [Clostridiales bacterium]